MAAVKVDHDDEDMIEDGIELLQDNKSKEQTLQSLLTGCLNIMQGIYSGRLLPDPLKASPYRQQTAIAAIILFLVLPFKTYILTMVLGIIIGYTLSLPEGERASIRAIRQKYQELEARSEALFTEASGDKASKQVSLIISKRLDPILNGLLSRLVVSLIDPWYEPQNKSGQREFQSCVRTTLDVALMNLIATIRSLHPDALTLYVYGLTNALIVHMQEFKEFEHSNLKAVDFLSSGQAKRPFPKGMQAEVGHFKHIISILLRRLLPKQESHSIVVVSLLKEIIASGALWSALDRCCDPDFINMKIVEALTEPMDLCAKLEEGWNLVIVKIIKSEELIMNGTDDAGLFCVIHIAGRKVRTRRISGKNLVWNESFQFKVSDQVLKRLKVHIQLFKYSYVGPDQSLGFAKLDIGNSGNVEHARLAYPIGKLFVESSVLTSKKSPAIQTNAVSPTVITCDFKGESEPADMSFEEALQNNEVFMEFHEFLADFKAPPYLQFFMNLDAFRQFTSMEIDTDPKYPEAIHNYFKSGELSKHQQEQLRMIKVDATDLFMAHFNDVGSKYPIPLNQDLLQEMKCNLEASDLVGADNRFRGNRIGPNIFVAAYKWMHGVLDEVYFSKFKKSAFFRRNHRLSKSYTLEDDVGSVVSFPATDASRNSDAGSIGTKLDHDELELGNDCDDPEMDIKKISTAISLLMQQLALIEDKLDTADAKESETLRRDQKNIEKQVQSLKNLVQRQRNTDDMPEVDFWLDLRNVTIRVKQSAESARNSHESLLNTLSESVFDIEAIRSIATEGKSSDELILSVVSRAFGDFEELHRKLKKAFPKLSKLTLPTRDAAVSDPNLLEAYLQLLVSDEFIRQSSDLRQFVSIDSDLEGKSLGETAGNLVEAVVGRKMTKALKNATSLLTGGLIGSRKDSPRFYETREHHTTTDIASNTPDLSAADLHRSRSVSSFIQPQEVPTKVTAFASVPATPMKSKQVKVQTLDPKEGKPFSPSLFSVTEFSESEMDMLLESAYTFLMEAFDLKGPNQWVRRKILSFSKQFIKQAYGDSFTKNLTDAMNDAFREDSFIAMLEILEKVLWPNGMFIKDVPPPNRTPDQQLSTQIEARALLLKKIPPSIINLTGRYNAVQGMTRIFNLLQEKDFNKLLFITFIDITVKIVFAES